MDLTDEDLREIYRHYNDGPSESDLKEIYSYYQGERPILDRASDFVQSSPLLARIGEATVGNLLEGTGAVFEAVQETREKYPRASQIYDAISSTLPLPKASYIPDGAGERLREFAKEKRQLSREQAPSPEGLLGTAYEAIPTLGKYAAATTALGGPLGLALMSADYGSQKVAEYLDKGVEPEQALAGGVTNAGARLVTSLPQVKIGQGLGVLGAALKGGLYEVPLGAAESLVEAGTDVALTGNTRTVGQFASEVGVQSTLAALLQGGARIRTKGRTLSKNEADIADVNKMLDDAAVEATPPKLEDLVKQAQESGLPIDKDIVPGLISAVTREQALNLKAVEDARIEGITTIEASRVRMAELAATISRGENLKSEATLKRIDEATAIPELKPAPKIQKPGIEVVSTLKPARIDSKQFFSELNQVIDGKTTARVEQAKRGELGQAATPREVAEILKVQGLEAKDRKVFDQGVELKRMADEIDHSKFRAEEYLNIFNSVTSARQKLAAYNVDEIIAAYRTRQEARPGGLQVPREIDLPKPEAQAPQGIVPARKYRPVRGEDITTTARNIFSELEPSRRDILSPQEIEIVRGYAARNNDARMMEAINEVDAAQTKLANAPQQLSLLGFLKDEGGFINFWTKSLDKSIEEATGVKRLQITKSEAETKLSPDLATIRGVYDTLAGPFRHFERIAEASPEAARVKQAIDRSEALAHSTGIDIRAMQLSRFQLPAQSKRKVDAALTALSAREKSGNKISPAQYQAFLQKFTPAEQQAIKDTHASMRHALNILEEATLNSREYSDPQLKQQWEDGVRAMFNEVREGSQYYVPLVRRGDKFIAVKNVVNDETPFVIHYGGRSGHTKATAIKRANDFINAQPNKSELKYINEKQKEFVDITDLIPSVKLSALEQLPGDMGIRPQDLSFLGDITAPGRGFAETHMRHAKGVEGYELDLDSPMIQYTESLARYVGQLSARAETTKAMQAMYQTHQNALLKYTQEKLRAYYQPSNKMAAGYKKALSAWMLSGIRSPLLNTTQNLTTTYPHLLGELGGAKATAKATKILGASIRDGFDFAWRGDFKGKNAWMNQPLRRLEKEGLFDSGGVVSNLAEFENATMLAKTVGNVAYESNADKIAATALTLFKRSERGNRIVATIAGLRAGKAKGLSGDALVEYARGFTKETQFDMSRLNRMPIYSGHPVAEAAGVFMSFRGHYIRFLLKSVRQKEWAKLFASGGAIMAIGGLKAVPWYLMFQEAAIRLAQENPEEWIEGLAEMGAGALFEGKSKAQATKVLKQVIEGGLPSAAGVTMTGSVNPLSLGYDSNDTLIEAAAKIALGASWAPVEMLTNAKTVYKASQTHGEGAMRALSEVAPEGFAGVPIKGALKAGIAMKDKAFKTRRGDPVITEEGVGKEAFRRAAILKGMGLNPTELNDAYSDMSKVYRAKEMIDSAKENLNKRYARAMDDGDAEMMASIRQEAAEKDIAVRKRVAALLGTTPDKIGPLVRFTKTNIKNARKDPERRLVDRMPRGAKPAVRDYLKEKGRL